MDTDERDLPAVLDLIAGRWRSQILFVGTDLGVFDAFEGPHPMTADDLAAAVGADAGTLYRLLRALASIGLLDERKDRHFALTPKGAHLRADHPASLRAMTLLEEGPVHYAAWKHLSEIVRSGASDGFRREFGTVYFDYMRGDPAYAHVFSEAMSSYSAAEAPSVRRAYRTEDLGQAVLCDIGGSRGALLAELLRDHPGARGIVFDLPEVVAGRCDQVTPSDGAGHPLEFIAGDMFERVPTADVYILKHILHDWADEDCGKILSVARRAAKPSSRLFLCEMIVPGPDEPHFSKLIDIHMMVVQSGKQRTEEELASLLDQAGWRRGPLRALDGSPLSVLEAEAR